jgi:type III secretion protein Q
MAAATVAQGLSEQLGVPVTVTATVSPSAVNLARAFPKHSAFALLDISSLGVHGVVEVEPAFLAGVLERLSGGAGKRGPVTELTRIEGIAFGYLVATALAAIRKEPLLEKRFAPRLLGVHQRREEFADRLSSERHVCVDVRVDVGELTGAVRVLIPATALQTAIQELPSTRPSTFETKVSKLEIDFNARMGKVALTAREIMDLDRGDVLVLSGMSLANGELTGAIRLSSSLTELAGDLTPNGFQLTRALLRRRPETELPMNAKDDATCTLPIELEIELARAQIPVGELAAIRPGAVVPLRINPADPVLIRIGDRTLAKAELVEIDGEVGARILSLVG